MSKVDDDPFNTTTKAIDASVGGLVWVRRRNGSWWPGQIMGLEEVSDCSLVSPKLGTPVKLLGREDASVDWYNLEKSKRVKPFRCGEYDDCIEKAKASAVNGKKTVKYARREDAILHALEIENARLGEDHVEFFSRTTGSGVENGISAKDLSTMSVSGEEGEDITEGSGSKDTMHTDSGLDSGSASDSAPELSQSGLSFEEPTHSGATKGHSIQAKRRRTPNDSEDDGLEGTRRMRGLEDLGMTIGDSSTGNAPSNGNLINGYRGNNSSSRRKRSQVTNFPEFFKKKNRRRTLTKVLECTAMVPVPVTCNPLPTSSGSLLQDIKASEKESNESSKGPSIIIDNNLVSIGVSCENGASVDPSELTCDDSNIKDMVNKDNDNTSCLLGLAENNSSDRLFDVPFIGEENRSSGTSPVCSASPSSERPESGGNLARQSSPISQSEDVFSKNDGLNEFESTNSATIHFNDISQRIEKDSSRWQSKGKRKLRHVSKNQKQDSRGDAAMDGGPNACLVGGECLGGSLHGPEQKLSYDDNIKPLSLQHCNSLDKLNFSPENQVEGVGDCSNSTSQNETSNKGLNHEVTLPPQRLLPYRQSRFTVNSRYQTSFIPGRNFFASNSRLFDIKLDVNSNYQPRHLPLVSLKSKLNGKAIVGHPLTVEVLDDGFYDAFVSSNVNLTPLLEASERGYTALQKSEAGRHPGKQMAQQPRFSPTTSSKSRKSGILSKKTRKLSSLTGNKEVRSKLVTKEKSPVVASIPLKVVFSRINEDLNRSTRQTHFAVTSPDHKI